MLDQKIIAKIEEFVFSKPRNIQEIAGSIGKNWRTADRYIEQIKEERGTLSTRTFREGTRGALKIVYWSAMEMASSSVFQEKLEQDIMASRKKEDFSAFDIFQHVDKKKKNVVVEEREGDNIEGLKKILLTAKKQLLIFSGNLSFINLKNKNLDMFDVYDELVKRGIPIKVICRVDLAGKENIERLLSLNFKYGKEMIEVRHSEHPLRAIIYDKDLVTIKEIKEPTGKVKELNKKIYIYYSIKDKDWIEWLTKIFWKIFNKSIDGRKRLEEINNVFGKSIKI